MGALLLVLVATAGPASASSVGGTSPQLVGTFLPDGTLVLLWTPDDYQDLGTSQVVTDGSLLYGSTLVVDAANPSTSVRTLTVDVEQYSPSTAVVPFHETFGNTTRVVNETVNVAVDPTWNNLSFPIPGHGVVGDTISLPGTGSSTLTVAVTMENVTFRFSHLTPDFLIPLPTTTGGEEVLVLAIVVWTGILAAVAVGLARRTMQKPGVGAPRSPVVWVTGAVTMVGFVWFLSGPIGFLQTVGGASPFVFPLAFALVFYLASLKPFETAVLAEVEQRHWTVPLTFSKFFIRIREAPDGEYYLALRTIAGFVYPLLGHPAKVETRPVRKVGDQDKAYAARVTFKGLASPRDRLAAQKAIERLQQLGIVAPPDVQERARAWVVTTDDPVGPKLKFKVASDAVIQWKPWEFHWTRSAQVSVPSSTPGASPTIHTRRRISPHVVDARLELPLDGEHWVDEEAAALNGSAIEKLSRALEISHLQVLQLTQTVDQEADRKTEERVRVLTSILERGTTPIDEVDAEREVRELRARGKRTASVEPKEDRESGTQR